MMAAVQGYSFPDILSGIILAVAFGLAAGNYACSMVHRLPRGRLLLDKTPYCGNCGTLLQVKDLFPVISALLLRHRCRYCKQPYPTSHTWTEVLVALLFVFTYLQYNFSEQYILIVLLGIFLITLAAIHANEGMIMGGVLVCVIVSGMMMRVLIDGTIYDFFQGALFAGMIGAALKHKEIKKVGHVYMPPKIVLLFAIGGLCVGVKELPEFFALFLGLYVLSTLNRRIPVTVPWGLAVIIPVLYPGLIN